MIKKIPILILVFIFISTLYIGFKKNINTRGMQSYHSPHFIIYHQNLKNSTLKDIEQKLETAQPAVQQFLNLRTENKHRVIVYPSIDSFQKAYLGYFLSFAFGDWAAGAAYKETLLLTSPENPGKQHSYEELLDIAVHEFVHTQIYRINPMPDIWLDEGLATYLAGQESKIENTTPPSFEQFQSQNQSEFIESHGYTWAYNYIEYLQEHYETKDIVCLLKTNDYQSCLSKSQQSIYNEWAASQ